MKRDADVSFIKYRDVSQTARRRVKRAIAKHARRNAQIVIREYSE